MKKLLVWALFGSLLWASGSLQDVIKSYIGQSRYETQKNLIDVLFAQSQTFSRANGSIDNVAVIDVLKKNGLIRLIYENPVQLRLAFRTKDEPLIFLKIINETLELMGYSYFITNNALRDQAGFVWEIYLQTEHILDPVSFANALGARGCTISNIIKNNDHYWFYDIDSKEAHAGVKTIEFGKNVHLGKPIKPYWVNIQGAKEVIITPNMGDHWYADVVFFDRNLEVLRAVKSEELTKQLRLEVPAGTVYVKLSDTVMLDNIKRGLSLHVKGN